MSRPYRPPIVFDSISREANTRFSLDAQSITYKPCRRFRFTIGSVIMPPTLRPSPSSISMTFRRQYVLPAPGRPVMPILSASPMPPTRRHKYALLYKNTLRIRRPRIGAARPAHGLRGSGLSPARGRNKGHKATRLWRLGSPLETRAPHRRDRDCDRRTSWSPLWDPGREHGSDGIRLLLPGGTDAAAVLCEPPFERLELPRAHSRDGHLRRRRTRPHDRGPRDEGTSLSCGGSDLRPDVHATGASVWGRDLPNVSEV